MPLLTAHCARDIASSQNKLRRLLDRIEGAARGSDKTPPAFELHVQQCEIDPTIRSELTRLGFKLQPFEAVLSGLGFGVSDPGDQPEQTPMYAIKWSSP